MSWLYKIRNALYAFFAGKTAAGPKPDPIPAQLRAPIAQKPGLACPACGTKIAITIDILLSQQAVYCTSCFLELRIDRQRSKESLAALEKLQLDFNRAHAMAAERH